METLNFRPEPFGGFSASRGHGCGCSACQKTCPQCGGIVRDEYELEVPTMFGTQLVDGVINPPTPKSYGKKSGGHDKFTTKRCTGGQPIACPDVTGIEHVMSIDGVTFDYIAGDGMMAFDRAAKKWVVKKRSTKGLLLLPRASACVSTFLSNMRAINMPVEAILSMGSLNCRCVSKTNHLSNHSYGDAFDVGGIRFVGGREILQANSECDAADRQLLHRINACLRLSFATVFDYHDRVRHKNHFHCDTNLNKGRNFGPGWGYVRESLGFAPKGGFTKEVANALRAFSGNPNAAKDEITLSRTLGDLFKREASQAAQPRPPRYECNTGVWVK